MVPGRPKDRRCRHKLRRSPVVEIASNSNSVAGGRDRQPARQGLSLAGGPNKVCGTSQAAGTEPTGPRKAHDSRAGRGVTCNGYGTPASGVHLVVDGIAYKNGFQLSAPGTCIENYGATAGRSARGTRASKRRSVMIGATCVEVLSLASLAMVGNNWLSDLVARQWRVWTSQGRRGNRDCGLGPAILPDIGVQLQLPRGLSVLDRPC